MSSWQILLGALLGGGLAFAGGKVSARWTSKPVPDWEVYLLTAIGAVLAVLLARQHPLDSYFFQQEVFIAILLTASLVDLHDRIIPNELMTVALAIGLAMIFVIPYADKNWLRGIEGGAAGAGILLGLALLVKNGMGLGDVKLAGIMGLYLGLYWVGMALILAFLAGGLIGAVLLVLRRVGRKDFIPFGPFLALGAVVAALWGPQIWNWYIGF